MKTMCLPHPLSWISKIIRAREHLEIIFLGTVCRVVFRNREPEYGLPQSLFWNIKFSLNRALQENLQPLTPLDKYPYRVIVTSALFSNFLLDNVSTCRTEHCIVENGNILKHSSNNVSTWNSARKSMNEFDWLSSKNRKTFQLNLNWIFFLNLF